MRLKASAFSRIIASYLCTVFRDDNCSLSQGRDGRWYFCFSLDEDQLAMLPQKLVTQAGAIAQKVIKKLFAL